MAILAFFPNKQLIITVFFLSWHIHKHIILLCQTQNTHSHHSGRWRHPVCSFGHQVGREWVPWRHQSALRERWRWRCVAMWTGRAAPQLHAAPETGYCRRGSRYKLHIHSTCRQQACPCPRQPRLSDVLFGVRSRVGVRVVPEFFSHEDDSSFKHGGRKHLQHLLICETVEQCPEIHMLQPWVQRPRQTDDLETHRPGAERQQVFSVCIRLCVCILVP